ncbi:MAG: helix-turn-helix transcriptional regulator [Armatimonadetes bacterium]|nr:helix-turn-helix transcriptional regulator [Armatimonadota bacterium]
MGTRAFDLLLETIRSAREGAGLSQREVARRLGFHPTVYGKMERGDRVLDVVEFVELARSIGVDPIELLGTFLVTVQQDRISQDLKTRD